MDEYLHTDEILVMNYIDGLMAPEEQQAFEARLRTDEALRGEVERLRLAVSAVRQFQTIEQVKKIHAEMKELMKPPARLVPIRTLRWALSAAAVLMLALGSIYLLRDHSSGEDLYRQAFVDYNVAAERGSDAASSAIATDYSRHQYEEVTQLSQSGAARNAEDSLLTGLSYLKLDQPAAAINWLRGIDKKRQQGADADFYLTLAYLKNKNYEQALIGVEWIQSHPRHPYHDQFSSTFTNRLKKLAGR